MVTAYVTKPDSVGVLLTGLVLIVVCSHPLFNTFSPSLFHLYLVFIIQLTGTKQTQSIDITLNSTAPSLTLNFQFTMSIVLLEEIALDGSILRSVEPSELNFTLISTQSGTNITHSYTAAVENGATLSFIVSFSLFIYLAFLFFYFIYFVDYLLPIVFDSHKYTTREFKCSELCQRHSFYWPLTDCYKLSTKLAISKYSQLAAHNFGILNNNKNR